MKLVILTGGRGTRLGMKNIPKPMVRIGGKPILEHQIDLARRYGIMDIYLLSGHLGEVIADYFGDGSKFGVKLTHVIEKRLLGTAGAIAQLEGRLAERFMVFYGDLFLDMDLRSLIDFDARGDSLATIVVHPNDHPHDSDLVEIDDENRVVAFHSKDRRKDGFYPNLLNAAIYILSPEIFEYIPKEKGLDLGKDIYPLILRSHRIIRAYKTAEYIKDIGTPERLKEVIRDFLDGRIRAVSKRNRRPAFFLDRDGTVIKEVDLLHKIEDVELFPFSAQAIRKINEAGQPCFLVTNQSVVARNLCSIPTVKEIHNKIETLLGREKAYLNDIYFCPHHPDKGYPGENSAFKIDCECRKPKVGLIRKAADEYNVDVKASWFIGDATMDVQTGRNATMKTVLLRTGKGGKDGKFKAVPDFVFDDLHEAVDFILSGKAKYENLLKEIINRISIRCSSPWIIAIGGQARSGKSTFVKCLSDYLLKMGISHKVIGLDHWLVGVKDRQDKMTVRERYDYRRVEKDIGTLLAHRKIIMQKYDPHSRMIVGEQEYALGDENGIIVEGVPALDIEGLRNVSLIKVYIEIDEETRKRRFFSFYAWKGLSEEEVQNLYSQRLLDEVVFIDGSKEHADLIVRS
jgi:histidinol-phosphate phosphatase family protein